MVLAIKMSTCPKVSERALLLSDHAITKKAETQSIVSPRPMVVDKRYYLVNEVAFEVQFADIRAAGPCLAVQCETANSDPVARHPLYFDLGGVEVVTAHPASRYPF
jgi:hypothetical protein